MRSICQLKNQWYVFYHRSSAHSKYNRRACVEPLMWTGYDSNKLPLLKLGRATPWHGSCPPGVQLCLIAVSEWSVAKCSVFRL
jgi:hypothetical protein